MIKIKTLPCTLAGYHVRELTHDDARSPIHLHDILMDALVCVVPRRLIVGSRLSVHLVRPLRSLSDPVQTRHLKVFMILRLQERKCYIRSHCIDLSSKSRTLISQV